jgi:hypothetical protein
VLPLLPAGNTNPVAGGMMIGPVVAVPPPPEEELPELEERGSVGVGGQGTI